MKTRCVISFKSEDDPSGGDNYIPPDDEEESAAGCSDTSDVASTLENASEIITHCQSCARRM